jgi:hypothetical protein
VDTFIGAGGLSDGLIAITDYAILIADVEPAVAKTLASRLADGSLDDLPRAKRIELSSLTSVQSNQHGHEVTLEHRDGKTTQITLATFADPATRDRALAVLQRRFGSAVRREETQFSMLRAIAIPLLWTVGIALFTWICVEAARELAGGADVPQRHATRPRNALFAAVLALIGPVGAFVLGSLATAAAGRWTYQRWRQPPLMVRLIRI